MTRKPDDPKAPSSSARKGRGLPNEPPPAKIIDLDAEKAKRGADGDAARNLERATDLGNARKLVRRYGADLRYVHAWDKWLVWRDGHWWVDEDGASMRAAKTVTEEMFAEAADIGDEQARLKARKHALDTQKAARLAAMVTLA